MKKKYEGGEQKKMEKERGITLIALVITIIVLLILAGITLNLALDEDGIIRKALSVRDEYKEAEQREQNTLNELYGMLSGNGTEETRTPVTLTEADIGKYVNYTPNGSSYTVTAAESGLDQIPENPREELEKQMRNKEQVFEPDPDMKWRLYRFNDEEVILIGSKCSEELLYLYR